MKNKSQIIIRKGYCLNLSKISQGYELSETICDADTSNQAKAILLKKIQYDGLTLVDGEDISYANIPVMSHKEADLIEVDGIQLRRHELESKIKEDARRKYLNEILEDSNIKYCFIKKRGTYYRPNSCGYTSFMLEAGIYSKQEAVSEALSCDEITIEAVNDTDYRKSIIDKIDKLSEKLASII